MIDNGQSAVGFGAYFGLIFRVSYFPNLAESGQNTMQKALTLLGFTNLLCLPAVLLTLMVQAKLASLTVV